MFMAEDAYQKAYGEIALFYRISANAIKAENEEQLLDIFLHELAMFFDAEIVVYAERKDGEIVPCRALGVQTSEPCVIKEGETSCWKALKENSPVIEFSKEGNLDLPQPIKRLKPRAVLHAPVTIFGAPKAVLCIIRLRPERFEESDAKNIKVIVNQLALNIERLRLKERTERIVEERTAKLRETEEALMNMIADLNKAYRELRTLDAAKDEFINITTHELKTPLTPIKIQAQLWLDGAYGELNEKQKESFRMILRNVTRLTLLIDDIMTIAKLDAGKIIFHFEKHLIGKLMEEVAEDFRDVCRVRRMSFSMNIPDELRKLEVEVDGERIKQVMSIYLDNAVKFTPEGGSIALSGEVKDGFVEITVADSGIGIPEEAIPKLFTRFYQVDKTITRKYGGTGLGLAIAKALIEKHGGRVWAKSAGLGKGSTFGFAIPLKKSKEGGEA